MSTVCPEETFTVSAVQRQLSESSGRPESGLTENSLATAVTRSTGRDGLNESVWPHLAFR